MVITITSHLEQYTQNLCGVKIEINLIQKLNKQENSLPHNLEHVIKIYPICLFQFSNYNMHTHTNTHTHQHT